jgi:hypothetical protein
MGELVISTSRISNLCLEQALRSRIRHQQSLVTMKTALNHSLLFLSLFLLAAAKPSSLVKRQSGTCIAGEGSNFLFCSGTACPGCEVGQSCTFEGRECCNPQGCVRGIHLSASFPLPLTCTNLPATSLESPSNHVLIGGLRHKVNGCDVWDQ